MAFTWLGGSFLALAFKINAFVLAGLPTTKTLNSGLPTSSIAFP
jgi:hypothetical protein